MSQQLILIPRIWIEKVDLKLIPSQYKSISQSGSMRLSKLSAVSINACAGPEKGDIQSIPVIESESRLYTAA